LIKIFDGGEIVYGHHILEKMKAGIEFPELVVECLI